MTPIPDDNPLTGPRDLINHGFQEVYVELRVITEGIKKAWRLIAEALQFL